MHTATRAGGRRPALIIVLLALATLVGLAAPPASEAVHHCGSVGVEVDGDERGAYAIWAKGISCRAARVVVRKYLVRGNPPGRWEIRSKPGGFVLHKGRKQVRFKAAG